MNTLQSCCAGPKHRMTIWKPLRHPVKQWAFQGSVDRCNWVEVENYWIINGGQHNKSKNWWTPMTKHEKWMEMDTEWMKYGWRKDNSGWNRINVDAEKKNMKNGWKLDGNGNIEHAWNHDYIKLNDQGLNRIKLDGGKQWIRDGKWIEIMDEAWMKNRWQWMNMAGNWCRMDEAWMKNGWKNAWTWIMNGWKMDRRCSKKSC
jgi:hypothetical protein